MCVRETMMDFFILEKKRNENENEFVCFFSESSSTGTIPNRRIHERPMSAVSVSV